MQLGAFTDSVAIIIVSNEDVPLYSLPHPGPFPEAKMSSSGMEEYLCFFIVKIISKDLPNRDLNKNVIII